MNFAHRYANRKTDAGTYFLGLLIGLFLGYIFLQMPGNNAQIMREDAVYLQKEDPYGPSLLYRYRLPG